MKVGIIVHSHTGNTLAVAQRLQEAMQKAGHSVSLARVEAVNEDPNEAASTALKTIPATEGYDFLVFAAPVRGFSLSPVMKLYLSGLQPLNGTRLGLFVTEAFPKAWMGGNNALKQMRKACEEKNGVVFKTCVINWPIKHREEQISALVEDFTRI